MAEKVANPAPLGLFGFGMTTVLLNLANAGIIALSSMILAMGIFYGGIAQIIAGIMEFKNQNMFGAIAFSSYGLFWETFVFLLLMHKWGWWAGPATGGLVAYLILWGIFTFLMWIVLFLAGGSWDLHLVFITLWILFFLLAIGEYTGSHGIMVFAGWEGMLCGALAMFAAFKSALASA